jgi:hypothetical protein
MVTWQDVVSPSRRALDSLVGRRVSVEAIYVRTGVRSARGREYLTVLLRRVRDAATGYLLADHVWFSRGNVWRNVGLRRGDIVRFDARVVEYRTGYWGPNRVYRAVTPPRVEYKLMPPVNLTIVGHRESWHPSQRSNT